MSISTELLRLSLSDMCREADKRQTKKQKKGNQVEWTFRDKSILRTNYKSAEAVDGGYIEVREYK